MAIGSARLMERICTVVERFDGDPPDSVQKFVMDQCHKWNLVWVRRNKVALEPDEVEMLLGFLKNHTRGGGISRTDRYKSLGNSFQRPERGLLEVRIIRHRRGTSQRKWPEVG